MAKINVNGPDAIPLYQWLRSNSSLRGMIIPWNFAKFLLNSKGEIVAYYPPNISPNAILPDIIAMLNAPEEAEELELLDDASEEVSQ